MAKAKVTITLDIEFDLCQYETEDIVTAELIKDVFMNENEPDKEGDSHMAEGVFEYRVKDAKIEVTNFESLLTK